MSIETLSRSLAFGSGLDLESIQRLWEIFSGHGHISTTVTSICEMESVAYFFHDSLGNGLSCPVHQMKIVKSHLGLNASLWAKDITPSLTLYFFIDKKENNISLPDCGDQMKYRDVLLRKISKRLCQCNVCCIAHETTDASVHRKQEGYRNRRYYYHFQNSRSFISTIGKSGDPYFQIGAWTCHVQRFFCKEEKVHVTPLHLRNVARQLSERRWKVAFQGPSCQSYYR